MTEKRFRAEGQWTNKDRFSGIDARCREIRRAVYRSTSGKRPRVVIIGLQEHWAQISLASICYNTHSERVVGLLATSVLRAVQTNDDTRISNTANFAKRVNSRRGQMLARIRTLLLGAGISGAMAFLAPAVHAIDGLILAEEQPAAHNGDAVRAVGFAADGLGGDWIFSGGEDARLRSWTLQLVEELVLTLDHTVYDLEASLDGSIVVTGEGGWNGGTTTDTLRTWSSDGLEVGTGAPIGFVYVVAISPDNSWIVASGFYGDFLIYEATNLELYATQVTGGKRTKAIAFSPDGTILASTWKGGTIQLWSFPKDQCAPQSCELELLPVLMSHPGTWDLSLAFSPTSTSAETKIVSGSDSGTVKVWTIQNLDDANPSVSVLPVDSGGVRSLAWSPDGSMIVAGGNGVITVYDTNTLGILAQEMNAHSSRVNDVAFSPDSSRIVSGGNDGALKLWQAPSIGCSVAANCDDSNDCTTDDCVGSVCQYTLADDNSSCNSGSGICCFGSCDTAVCSFNTDCDDGDSCSTTDTCTNGGTCAAECDNSFPACDLIVSDACCGPACDPGTDIDCTCVPTHNKEKGPRCRDGIDNDCDGLTDGDDPDC